MAADPTTKKMEYLLRRVERNGTEYVVVPVNRSHSPSLAAFANSQADITAFASIENSLHAVGWDEVLFGAPPRVLSANANDGYYGAGFLEGYLTAERTYNNFINVLWNFTADRSRPNVRAKLFILNHMEYLANISSGSVVLSDAPVGYVMQLKKLLTQLHGFHHGYTKRAVEVNAATGDRTLKLLSFYEVFLLSYHSEIADVDEYLSSIADGGSQFTNQYNSQRCNGVLRAVGRPRCSALIKPVPTDLFAAHTTWSSFNEMMRQYKTYVFETTVSMSSYPGSLSSTDDWYMTSHGLAVQETSLLLFNATLYREHFTVSKVSAFLRAMISNFLAKNGSQWQSTFVYQNSGSYNNQWMVVDMKLFQPCNNQSNTSVGGSTTSRSSSASSCNASSLASVPDHLLWISETLPGHHAIADVSHVVRSRGYWASYNIPYFKDIFRLSGNLLMEETYGAYFSHDHSYRAEIFARNHSMVHNLASMKGLMRYNNYKHDPLADIPNCTGTIYNGTCRPKRSAMLQVSARGDLDPVGHADEMGPLARHSVGIHVGRQNMGAIDAKIASWSNFQEINVLAFDLDNANGTKSNNSTSVLVKVAKLRGVVISGPTAVQQQPFDYATAPQSIRDHSHIGLPRQWHFGWEEYSASSLSLTPDPTPSTPAWKKLLVVAIVSIAGAAILLLNIVVIVLVKQGKIQRGDSHPHGHIRPSPPIPGHPTSSGSEGAPLIQSS